MANRYLHGRAFVRGTILDDVLVILSGGTIADVVQTTDVPASAERTSGLIVPGFIDCHVHGGDGADFMDAEDAGIARILAFHARHGTTALAATTLSAAPDDLQRAVKAIARASRASPGICAIHLEGPYINSERAGAQDRSAIRPADVQEVAALLAEAPELRWMITLAPELAGAREVIEHFRGRVRLAIGHTAADYETAVSALAWGASHFTHLFNAMTGLHHREPGAAAAALLSS